MVGQVSDEDDASALPTELQLLPIPVIRGTGLEPALRGSQPLVPNRLHHPLGERERERERPAMSLSRARARAGAPAIVCATCHTLAIPAKSTASPARGVWSTASAPEVIAPSSGPMSASFRNPPTVVAVLFRALTRLLSFTGPAGVEPAAVRSTTGCSDQLSYSPKVRCAAGATKQRMRRAAGVA